MRYNAGGRPGPARYTGASSGWTATLDASGEPLPAGPERPSEQNATDRPATPREAP